MTRRHWRRAGFRLLAAAMDRTNKPELERKSAHLAPTPELSPVHPELVATVPASCVFRRFGHLMMQPKPGHSPIFLYRGRRQIQDPRRFLDGKAAEESQLDYVALLLIEFRQFVQSVVESNHVDAPALEGERIIQFQPESPISSGGVSAARVIDENLPHQLSADG